MRYILMLLTLVCVGCTPCQDQKCLNGGADKQGFDCECKCDEGWKGEKCQTPVIDTFTGAYVGSLNCKRFDADTFYVANARGKTAVLYFDNQEIDITYRNDNTAKIFYNNAEGFYNSVTGEMSSANGRQYKLELTYRRDNAKLNCTGSLTKLD